MGRLRYYMLRKNDYSEINKAFWPVMLLLLETKDWTNEGDYKPTDTHIKSLMI